MIPTRLRLGAGGSAVPFLALTFVVASFLATSSAYAEPSIVQRERERRASQALEAQQELERGDKAYEAGNYEEAVGAYATARGLLGPGAQTNALWNAAADRYAQASVERAKQLAKTGRQDEAHRLLDSVLAADVAPGHAGATQLKGQIDDPIRYNPGLTPEHVENVDKVRRLLYEAEGFKDLGRYGQSQAFYEDVLRIDPYNTAARRGLEVLGGLKSDYYDSARDQAKAAMMAEVGEAWEVKPIPVEDLSFLAEEFGTTDVGRAAEEKLRSIMVPAVDLDQVTLSEAVEFLRQMSIAYDLAEIDQDRKGISFVVDMGTGESELAKAIMRKRFSLKLQRVPLGKILDYINDATGTKSRIDAHAVIIRPEGAISNDMMTRSFRVPPDLLSREALGGDGGGGDDPFAEAAPAKGLLPKRLSPKEFLKKHGASFPEGASASLTRGVLRVTNTRLNLDYVEQIVAGIVEDEPVVVVVETRFINVSQNYLEEKGYDWMTTGGRVGGDIYYGGGTPGNGTEIGDFGVDGSRSLTSGLRSGAGTSEEDSLTTLLRSGVSNGGALLNGNLRAPGIVSLVGVYDDTTIGVMLRGLSQGGADDETVKKTIVTRSGQKALIQSVREMIVPTEYEPPELPNSVGVETLGGGDGGVDVGVGTFFPVTPATPTAFETVNVGCELEVEPLVGPNRQLVELALAPTIKRFEGFINYGSPIFGGVGLSVAITENRIEMPVFSVIRADSNLTIADGQTVVMGGLLEDKSFKYEDKVPLLGDVPVVGQFFRSESETHDKNAMVIFVKVSLLDPSGRPYRDR